MAEMLRARQKLQPPRTARVLGDADLDQPARDPLGLRQRVGVRELPPAAQQGPGIEQVAVAGIVVVARFPRFARHEAPSKKRVLPHRQKGIGPAPDRVEGGPVIRGHREQKPPGLPLGMADVALIVVDHPPFGRQEPGAPILPTGKARRQRQRPHRRQPREAGRTGQPNEAGAAVEIPRAHASLLKLRRRAMSLMSWPKCTSTTPGADPWV